MQFDHDDVMAAAAFEVKASPDTARYHAFDRVRALAILLGVVYHALLFPTLMGGWDPGATGPSSAPRLLGDWMHSFRMPLFFLIAGFFGRMMLTRYETAGFLGRRWRPIGLPLMIGVLTFSPLNTLTLDLVKQPPAYSTGAPGSARPAGDALSPRDGPQAGPSATSGPADSLTFTPGGEIARRLFGPFARLFHLYHLLFLWYLLIFVTVAPFLAGGWRSSPRRRRTTRGIGPDSAWSGSAWPRRCWRPPPRPLCWRRGTTPTGSSAPPRRSSRRSPTS
jgi:fucose 4-O-acetylase-like acetyltransferase